jgi:hypothetical protein
MSHGVIVATWDDGVFVVTEESRRHELPRRAVRGLTTDGRDGILAIVDGHTLQRRNDEGDWTTLAEAECELSCCVASRGEVYVGSDDARVFRLTRGGALFSLDAFATVEGRDTWFAGQALVNGTLMGPPLGVRSLTATADGVLLANVHVGGIPRSSDGGASWQPTIAVDADVHEVRAHPSRPNIVAAASAVGLWLSRDGGAEWTRHQEGLHASYCSAVAFVRDEVWVAASEDHFARRGRIYRCPLDQPCPLTPVSGLPEWTDGIVDTQCIAVHAADVACADVAGNLYVSRDHGGSWSKWATGLPSPSSTAWCQTSGASSVG